MTRMLFLHSGPWSGIAPALLRAWRAGSPEVAVKSVELLPPWRRGLGGILRTLPYALVRGGPSVLLRGKGRFTDAVKYSVRFLEDRRRLVDRIVRDTEFDFVLHIGTVGPLGQLKRPYFVYTDHPVLANLYLPGGEERVEHRKDRLPYERKTLEGARLVFSMSSYASRAFREQYGLAAEKIVCVRAGCNVPAAEQYDPRRFESQNILFVGLDWERKGGPQLVEAFLLVRRRCPRATLTVVGADPDIDVPGVEVVGRVPQRQVSDYLGKAAVFCMPTRREPFGIVYLEAMRAGLPVVATDICAIPDFVLEGQTGHRVSVDDVDSLAERLEQLISDPQECRRMGERGRALVESKYTWARTQQMMWAAIRSVLQP